MQIFTSQKTGFTAFLKALICIAFLLLAGFQETAFAQQRFTLSGYLRDSTSGEALIYATIYPEALKTGVSTNEYGFFSITLPEGKYSVVFSYVGYQTIKREINLDKNIHENFSLSPLDTKIDEITVIGQHKENIIRQ
ncbi:MAG: carboxypeptidase-like regulatory domain-containing protein, partial [Bacteroidia bacterium]|nr:carboxypeptidase-like regulatory domain-containing protein [Bacteroidia bacterium]